MTNYDIFTDSSCDLPKEMVEKFGLKVIQLEVIIDNKEPLLNQDVDIADFYNQLANGATAKTAAATPGYFDEKMRESLDAGRDILYIGFSSGLSVTYNNGAMIMEELKAEYPDRKLYAIDSLCAALGQGLLVNYAAQLKEKGATIEELRDEILRVKDKIHHQVTVNDLMFLKRGGRLDAASAILGTMIKIKPIIVVDEEGHLVSVDKVRGRKNALKELVLRMKENEDVANMNDVYICHSDCITDAERLRDMVKEEFPQVDIMIGDIGPVIGAHTGPGTIALFYLGKTTKGTQK